MKDERETVFEFLERVGPRTPEVVTVTRTTKSKYQFYLVVRHYRKRVRGRPTFFTYSKGDVNAVKGTIEEHRLLDERMLYVLEGFSQRFVDGLALPPETFVVAETDGGQLRVEQYHYRQKRNILRILLNQLNVGLSLRELMKMDWSIMRDFEGFEPLLRTAKIMEWTESDLGRRLSRMETGNVLTLTKRGRVKELLGMTKKYGAGWMLRHTTEVLTEALHFRALMLMGYEPEKCARELGIGWRRRKELEEVTKMLTLEELGVLADRLLKMDALIERSRTLGMDLFYLNNPVKVR